MNIPISNKRALTKIAENMKKLATVFHENGLFICHHPDANRGESSIILLIRKDDNDKDGYLGIRQLLSELKYRIDKDTKFNIDFTINRKDESGDA